VVTVPGDQALSTWRRLLREGTGWPVVLGGDEDLQMIVEGLLEIDSRSPEEILAAADKLTFPQSLAERRAEDDRRAREWLAANGDDTELDEAQEPPLGDWPDEGGAIGFTIATEVLTGKPIDEVHIAILPCDNGWQAIAYLRWGGWNENPHAEYHVAALRSWHERFGAELVGASHDVINLHVATRPATREAALTLAREQYLYCADVVDQGTETLSALAAALMDDDWWYFWWD
jgi:hypothetical protein